MFRTTLSLWLILSAGSTELGSAEAPGAKDALLQARARRIHEQSIPVDTHNDITGAMTDAGYDLGESSTGIFHTDFSRLERGGVSALFFSIWVDPAKYATNGGTARALRMIDAVYQAAAKHPDKLRLATSVADIRQAKREGRIAALLGIEGGYAIENSLETLRAFHRLGVRYMTLTHTRSTDWAGATTNGPGTGLTAFGREVVREMNRLGMLVDISHVSDATMGDVLDMARVPVIVKDNFGTADLPTTAGSLALKHFIPPDDAFQVRQLRDAGALVLAKSNMDEWAFRPVCTVSSVAGITRNPYDLERVPAGSSGGTAAAVAANLGLVGLGSDTGNSIRGPSAHTALVGIRSTMGLTSRTGIIPLCSRNDIGGPMARTVADAVRILDVIAGVDPADSITQLARNHREPSYLTSLARDVYHEPRNMAFREAVLAAMNAARVDAILYPTWSNPPRRIGDMQSPAGDNSQWLSPHTGMPAMTVPMGYTHETLPAGITFLGRLFREADLIRFAYAYEQATQHRRAPRDFPALKPAWH